MKSDLPNKRNPFLQGMKTLPFDNAPDADIRKLTDAQKADAFLTKYMSVFNPVETYAKYFQSSAKTLEHTLKDMKTFYIKLVVHGGWTEKKYVIILNDIFTERIPLSVFSLDRMGLQFDRKYPRRRR